MKNAHPIKDEVSAPCQGDPIVAAAGALHWLDDLQALAVRFAGLGITPDLATMTLAEAWGLFLFLRQLAEGQQA